jgi:hypothetical protein
VDLAGNPEIREAGVNILSAGLALQLDAAAQGFIFGA